MLICVRNYDVVSIFFACAAAEQIALVKSSEEAGGSFKKLATFKLPFGSDDAASGAWCITADCFQAVSTTTSLSTAGWA